MENHTPEEQVAIESPVLLAIGDSLVTKHGHTVMLCKGLGIHGHYFFSHYVGGLNVVYGGVHFDTADDVAKGSKHLLGVTVTVMCRSAQANQQTGKDVTAMIWKPITEAPKTPDGPMHSVLLGFEDSGEGGWPSCQGYWSQMLNDWVVASPFTPAYEMLSSMTDYRPTHFMPRPPAPGT